MAWRGVLSSIMPFSSACTCAGVGAPPHQPSSTRTAVAGARVPHGLSIGQWAAEGAKAAKALALLRVAAVAAVAMVAAAAVAAVTYWEGYWAITGIAA